jgi:redox-sensing transcriptional repressor
LGKAIANYQGFHDRGFRIVAVLDNDPQKIGGKVGDFIVRDISQAFRLIPQMDIRVAMLTIPAESAQVVADILIEAGILAILNYAPIPLRIPRNIQIQYLDPLIQLSHMSYYL